MHHLHTYAIHSYIHVYMYTSLSLSPFGYTFIHTNTWQSPDRLCKNPTYSRQLAAKTDKTKPQISDKAQKSERKVTTNVNNR